jgi:hypothetical protein
MTLQSVILTTPSVRCDFRTIRTPSSSARLPQSQALFFVPREWRDRFFVFNATFAKSK